MTPDEIKESRRICDAATEGPWGVFADAVIIVDDEQELRWWNDRYISASDALVISSTNMNFVVHARTFLTKALDYIEQLLEESFMDNAYYEKEGARAGWWDSGAKSSVRNLGDELVELGKWERHPDGVGRRWWYRLKETP